MSLDKVLRNINRFEADTVRRAQQSLDRSAQHLLSQSVNLAPLDLRDLRDSGRWLVDGLSAYVTYNTPYALRMHEDMQYTPQEPGTGPKYLTTPLNQNRSRYYRQLVQDLKVRS